MKPVLYGDCAVTADKLCAVINQMKNNQGDYDREFITLYESTLKTDCACTCRHRIVPVSVFIGIAAILFYAFTKVTSVWILPVCYLLILWLYHNSRKDKEFLSLQMHGVKNCLQQNIYCSVYRLLFRG